MRGVTLDLFTNVFRFGEMNGEIEESRGVTSAETEDGIFIYLFIYLE